MGVRANCHLGQTFLTPSCSPALPPRSSSTGIFPLLPSLSLLTYIHGDGQMHGVIKGFNLLFQQQKQANGGERSLHSHSAGTPLGSNANYSFLLCFWFFSLCFILMQRCYSLTVTTPRGAEKTRKPQYICLTYNVTFFYFSNSDTVIIMNFKNIFSTFSASSIIALSSRCFFPSFFL